MTQKAPTRRQPPVIQQYLTRHKDQIAAALPKHVDADRMARIALTECRKTPQLLNANPQSLFGAIIQCSQLGLEPGNALGHAYLLPFKNRRKNRTDVQLIIGYRGMIDLARRSGQIVSLNARAVYEQDEFSYEFGLHEDLRHVPSEERDRGELTHVYAVAKLKDGGVQWDVMSRPSIEAIRNESQGYKFAKSKNRDDNPWMTHFEEMAKKTVIRRLFKYLPVSVEIQRAAAFDEMADAGVNQQNGSIIEGDWEPGPFEESEPDEPKSKTESVKDRLRETDVQSNGPDYDTLAALIKEAGSDEEIDDAMAQAGDFTDDGLEALEKLAAERRKQIEAEA